jgi:hypothetical protein
MLLVMEEIWKSIPNYEGLYEVSNLGRVKSLSRFVNSGMGYKIKERILKPITDGHGYINVGLSSKKYKVHKLVAIVFLGHTPNGYALVVDHINNIKTDNRVNNLQLITNRENCSKDRKNKSSKYIGVTWDKQTNKWRTSIIINKKRINLGRFLNEEDASIAYQNKLKEILC